jgi:hypothetical protein
MLSSNSLSKKDFVESNWEEVVNKSEQKEISKYQNLFSKAAEKVSLETEENKRKADVFTLLAKITLPNLKYPKDKNEDSTEDNFSYQRDVEQLIKTHLNVLKEWVPEITDTELYARITDVIWNLENDNNLKLKMAKLAVGAYLKSAKNLEKPDEWTLGFIRIQRAIEIASKITNKPFNDVEEFNNVVTHIKNILDNCNLDNYTGKNPPLFFAKLMKLLQYYQKGDQLKRSASKYAAFADKAATLARAAFDETRAEEYQEIKDKWDSIAEEY